MKDAPDIASGRLSAETYAVNFDDVRPPLGRSPALVESSHFNSEIQWSTMKRRDTPSPA